MTLNFHVINAMQAIRVSSQFDARRISYFIQGIQYVGVGVGVGRCLIARLLFAMTVLDVPIMVTVAIK